MVQVHERHAHPKYPRLSIQRRSNSKYYQAVIFLDGKLRQSSLKTAALPAAFKLGEEWYRKQLRASVQFGRQHPVERLTTDPVVGELFTAYSASLDRARRAEADKRWGPIQDFWRAINIRDVLPTTFREFYKWRRQRMKGIRAHTLHKDIVLVRQILKHAAEENVIDRLPVIASPGRIKNNPRPWLTRQEWDHLMKVSEKRLMEAFENNRLFEQRVDTDEFAKLMVTTMCRVGELLALCFRDCRFERRTGPDDTGAKSSRAARDEMLIAEVTGKRGTRTIVAPPEAARIVKARRARLKGLKADDPAIDELRVFPEHHRDAFRELLKAADLHRDAQGFTRNFKSLRATAISFRLLAAGPTANLLMIARAAGTSVQMIDQFYAKRLSAELFKDDLAATVVEIE